MKEFFNSVGDWFLANWQPIVKTLAIIIFGVVIVKIILAIVKRQLQKTKLEKTVQSFVSSILRFVLYLILIFCIISSLGISVTGLTVVISAISLAISLALQDSLKNLVNGFIIISTSLLKQGDWVNIAGEEGSVQDVRMLYTVLVTGDNKKITIPNSTILASNIINYNTLKNRRLDLTFDVAYSSDVDLVKKVVNEVIDSCEMIYKDPAPTVVLANLGASSITFNVRVWCSGDDYWNTKWYVLDNVFNEFKRNNISIPFNQLEVALVEPNQPQYVREQGLGVAKEHKTKFVADDDIIARMSKTLKKATEVSKKHKKNKKQNKQEETNKEEK